MEFVSFLVFRFSALLYLAFAAIGIGHDAINRDGCNAADSADACTAEQDDTVSMLAMLKHQSGHASRSNAAPADSEKDWSSLAHSIQAARHLAEQNLSKIPIEVEGRLQNHWSQMFKASKGERGSAASSYSNYDIDESDYRKYVSGEHRRPTDPPTRAEIVLLQQFLFGSEPFDSVSAADDLFNCQKWKEVNRKLSKAGIGGMHPGTIRSVLDEPACTSDSGVSYEELVDEYGVDQAFEKLVESSDNICKNKNLWNAREVGVEVPDRQHIIDVETAIEEGISDYPMRRILSVRLEGGYHGKSRGKGGDYTKWGSTVYIAVDVADPANLSVTGQYVEVYEKAIDYGIKPPSPKPLDDSSAAILQTAMSAFYLSYAEMGTNNGLPFNYLPKYNGDVSDFDGVPLTYVMKYAIPFEHKYKKRAYVYGEGAKQWIMSAELTNFRSEDMPIDGHGLSAGTLIANMPLTFLYVINETGDYVNPEQTLPSFFGGKAESAAMTWYGRGLIFNETGGINLLAAAAAHMKVDVSGTPLEPWKKEVNELMYAEVASIVSEAIRDAWGNEEAIKGTGFRPGKLVKKTMAGSKVKVPADTITHDFKTPSFNNHATSEAFVGNPFLPPGSTRDARNNPDSMAPPTDANGVPEYAPNGPPPPPHDDENTPFTIDGYAVTYDVGMKWKVLLSFDRTAGLTFWNVRMRLPPSKAYPEGQEYPMLFRANVPNFGTDYTTNSLGTPQNRVFLESQATAATTHVKGASCKGKLLPLFKHRGGGGPHLMNKFGLTSASYATLGVPGFVDPIVGLPMEGFPAFESGSTNDVVIEEAICIEDHVMGLANWHTYQMQHERCMTVSMTAISEAYNMVVKGDFCNTGHAFVGQDLQGKPAVAGGAAGIEGVEGAYASGGRGGFAHNHIHWSAVALEGFVGGGPKSVLEVVETRQDVDTDPYGMAFTYGYTEVKSGRDTDSLTYDYAKGRTYRLSGKDENGTDIGGMLVESMCWGNKIKESKGNKKAKIPEERTYYGNHWWLRGQDVFVSKVDQRKRGRDTMDLLAQGRVGEHYDLKRSTGPAAKPEKKLGDSFAMYAILKKRHNVIAEELPIQAVIKSHGLMLKPHFLERFNMDILMRYGPEWNRKMQENFIGDGGDEYVESLTYDSEFA
eukprot:TRINITY_DN45423_c0_g1_i1.p1 TRINITY_DN45423_c0_g1~~TRINITY_DN45423_c0_g1_i1.p1  ORF type:complete len:1144 (-),score=245.48 TRINITY_DN45423_c0_g1_i1:235-3666(-)